MPEFIADNLQILIGLAAAVAYWINHHREKKQQEQEMRDLPEEDMFGPDFDFGEPEAQTPPPWVPPPVRAVPPPLPSVAAAPRASDRELARQQELQERLRQLREARKAAPGGAAATKARVAGKTKAAPGEGLQARLRDRSEVRRAVVMREILGPPVGLR